MQWVEEFGSYHAHIWPLVYKETGAKGLLLVEPPKEFDVTQGRFEFVSHWASAAGLAVHKLSETEEIAKQIADELNHSPFSEVSFRK